MTVTRLDGGTDSSALLAFLQTLFLRLRDAQLPFAVIHDGDDLAALLDGDVDLALGERPDGRFAGILAAACAEHALALVNVLHYEIPHGYYFILASRGSPRRFLHLDCLHDPEGLGRYLASTDFLIADADPSAGYPRTRADRMAAYLLVKRAIKGQADHARLAELRALLQAHGPAVAAHLQSFAGCPADDVIAEFLTSTTDDRAVAALTRFRRRLEQALRDQGGQRLRRAWLTAHRQLNRLLRPTGFFVVLVGPDGCGKSTVAAELLARLERGFRHTDRFHWRPGLLPKLGRQSPGEAAAAAQVPPTGESRYRGFVSLARFFYYGVDFIAGYVLRLYPIRAQTTLLLGERYFTDVMVNPARYGFAVPASLLRLVARFVPRPDLTVLLRNDPEVIHQRKPELTVEQIRDQLVRFEAELPRWGEHLTVTTDVPAVEVAERIADRILALCEQRTARRMARRLARY